MSIETDGINALGNFISQSKLLELHEKKRDKYPIWDGEIFIYTKPNHKENNEFFKCRVPIQIKTNKVESLSEVDDKYQIAYLDLKHYLNHGGVLLLRPIYVTTTEYRIFQKLLLPVDIDTFTSQKKFPEQKSISIELLEVKDIKLFELICNYFFDNQKLQFSFSDNNYNLVEILKENKNLTLKTISKPNLKDAIFSDYGYIYIETKEGIQIPTNLKITELHCGINSIIKINGKIYFSDFKRIYNKKDEIIFHFNTALRLELIKNHTLCFNLKQEEDVLFDDLLTANEFLDELEKTGSFSSDNELLPIPIQVQAKKNLKHIDYLKKIDQMLKFFKVDTKKIKFKDLIEQNVLIDTLVGLFIENQFAIIENSYSELNFKVFTLINRKILIMFVKNESGSFVAYNYCSAKFQKDFMIQDQEINISIPCSRFIDLLKIPQFKHYEVFDGYFELIETDLIKFYDSRLKNIYGKLMLDLILEFDKSGKEEYLNLANKINLLIYNPQDELRDEQIYNINRIQIIKRKSSLNKNDLEYLIKIKSESTDKDMICCANILLESYNEFDILFSLLSDAEKSNFKSWPIWKLYQQRKT